MRKKLETVIGVTNSRVVKVKEIYEQNTRGILSSSVNILCNICLITVSFKVNKGNKLGTLATVRLIEGAYLIRCPVLIQDSLYFILERSMFFHAGSSSLAFLAG